MEGTQKNFVDSTPANILEQIKEDNAANVNNSQQSLFDQPAMEPVSSAVEESIDNSAVEENDFISEDFERLSKEEIKITPDDINLAPVIASPKPSTTSTDENSSPIAVKKQLTALDRIVVDLSKIEIVEKSPMLQIVDENTIFRGKATYQVVALQSAYVAFMSALTMRNINSIMDSNVDLFNHKTNVYKAIHNHIEDTNLGKIGFTDWLKCTSYHDIETLEYGIYCQTFPEKNEFDVTCGSCNKKTSIVVNNETLVQAENEGLVVDRIMEVTKTVSKPEDLIGKSMVHTMDRIILPESKIVVDIYTPSLYDHLEILKNVDQKLIEQESTSISLMLFIKAMYMLDVDGSLKSGIAKYYPIVGNNKILGIISELSHKDGLFLERSIEERIRKYSVTFSVKNQKCSHCQDSLGSLPIEIEQALFTMLQRGRAV
jgi:hypothetical protein